MPDPREHWLSEHFRLSDFLGNHSVYSLGVANRVESLSQLQRDNARALCEFALEPLAEQFGPMTISYGLISPEFSRRFVTYKDPNEPSHHRWDLGAAADVIVHKWVLGAHVGGREAASVAGGALASPIALAHTIDSTLRLPYSRLITYSEAPGLCVAVSAREVQEGKPRFAFYENRFEGKTRQKPKYLSYSTGNAKKRAKEALDREGLPCDWRGKGHPTYHGGGRKQYQHMRVSRYTTVLDWLFNLQSISNGAKNIPALHDTTVQDAFVAAGLAYDRAVDFLGAPRLSILRGFVCRTHPDWAVGKDWRAPEITFELGAPQSMNPERFYRALRRAFDDRGHILHLEVRPTELGAEIELCVDDFLEKEASCEAS